MLATAVYIVLYLVRFRNEFFVEPEVGFRALYGFIGMMIGSFVYEKREKIAKSRKGMFFSIAAILCCCGFLGTKLLMNRLDIVIKLQFMTQVFGVAFAVFALLGGLCFEERIKSFMASIIGKVLGIISTCSLEVYLVQFAIIKYLKEIIFPANLLLILAATIGCAYAVHFISEKITKAINARL